MDNRSDIRGTSSYAAQALKGQAQFWIDEINKSRRQKNLSPINIRGRDWDQLDDSEKRNIQHAQTEKRLQAARDDARLAELERELARLKAELARES